jgi:hypothetical protein
LGAVPKYSFEIRTPVKTETISDVELADELAALDQAVLYAKEEMVDGIIEGFDRTDWEETVRDERGNELVKIRFSDVLQKE